jgi:predicted nucleotidyltransferase
MTELAALASEVGASERTLRRAAGRGTIRAIRTSPRRAIVPSAEYDYVRRNWGLVSGLVQELRTLPNVRLATLFGSVARGDHGAESDIDLLVGLRKDGMRERARLAERVESATGRPVQIVVLADALDRPELVDGALRDGRVLIDRDGDWSKLKSGESRIRRQAEEHGRLLEDRLGAALGELGVS